MERISFDCRWKPGWPGFHRLLCRRISGTSRSGAVDGRIFDLEKQIRGLLVTVFGNLRPGLRCAEQANPSVFRLPGPRPAQRPTPTRLPERRPCQIVRSSCGARVRHPNR